MSIAESSRDPGYGEDVGPGGVPYHPLSHSNSTNSFASSSSSAVGGAMGHHYHNSGGGGGSSRGSSQRTQL